MGRQDATERSGEAVCRLQVPVRVAAVQEMRVPRHPARWGAPALCALLMIVSACGEEEVVTFPGPRTPTPVTEGGGAASETPAQPGSDLPGVTARPSASSAPAPAPGGCFDISGRWDGGFRSPTGLDGTAIVQLTQDGCAIGGTSVFTDAPCFSAADVRGTLFPGTSPDDWIFEGELFGLTPQGGELLVEVAGPIRTGSRPLRGTFDYFVAAGGVCTGNNGVINIEQP